MEKKLGHEVYASGTIRYKAAQILPYPLYYLDSAVDFESPVEYGSYHIRKLRRVYGSIQIIEELSCFYLLAKGSKLLKCYKIHSLTTFPCGCQLLSFLFLIEYFRFSLRNKKRKNLKSGSTETWVFHTYGKLALLFGQPKK